MDRRSFLKVLGTVPLVPSVLATLPEKEVASAKDYDVWVFALPSPPGELGSAILRGSTDGYEN